MPADIKINLLPRDRFETSNLGKFLDWAVSIGRWIVILTEFVVICAFLSRFYFDTKLANLFDEVKQKRAIVDSALSFEENFLSVQERIKIVKNLLAQERKPSGILAEISQILPFDIFLTTASIEEDQLSLKGYFLSEKNFNAFLAGLINSSRFEEINLNKISSQKENPSLVDFSISAKIKK